jgi:hypothetical protein
MIMTPTQKKKIGWGKLPEGRMEKVRRLRAMASLCRQSAAYHPDRKWKLLAEAEYWEHAASEVLRGHFAECTACSLEQPIANANSTSAGVAA